MRLLSISISCFCTQSDKIDSQFQGSNTDHDGGPEKIVASPFETKKCTEKILTRVAESFIGQHSIQKWNKSVFLIPVGVRLDEIESPTDKVIVLCEGKYSQPVTFFRTLLLHVVSPSNQIIPLSLLGLYSWSLTRCHFTYMCICAIKACDFNLIFFSIRFRSHQILKISSIRSVRY